jgi:hypothetical protein
MIEAPILGRAQFWMLIGVAMAAAICWAFFGPLRPSVRLLTGPGLVSGSMVGCYTSFALGQLEVDPASGTAIVENGRRTPVMWPYGYTGRQSVLGVEVADASGHVVANTGTRVQIEGGYTGGAFFACGYVLSR